MPPPGWVMVPVPAAGAPAPDGSGSATGTAAPAPPAAVLPPGAPPVPAVPAPVGLAGWEDRAYATLLDIAVGVSLIQLYYLMLSSVGWLGQAAVWLAGGDYETVVDGGYWALSLVWWGWQWALRGRTGQSLGQRLIGVRVVDIQTRRPIGPGRSLTHALDVLPLGIGFVRPTWDRQRQTWADRIHHTVVLAAR
ncbi:RDD family protein [Streptomyces sp. NPDC059396]|uniref:RDD family protein n=1 Tax=Streptomyces sp. NPDC059396 TaxID=3346819 RepID=UPI0036C42D4E